MLELQLPIKYSHFLIEGLVVSVVGEFLDHAINLLRECVEIIFALLYGSFKWSAFITLPIVAILALSGQAALALSFLKEATFLTLAFTAMHFTVGFTGSFFSNLFYNIHYPIHTALNRIFDRFYVRPLRYLDKLSDKIYSSLFNAVKKLLNPFYQFCKFKSLQVRTAFNIYFYKESALSPLKYMPMMEYAVKHGHVDRLRWLQTHGVGVSFYACGIWTSEGSSLLKEAIKNRQLEVVNFLLERILLNNLTWDATCQNFLILAVSLEHVGITQALLNKMTSTQVDRAIKLAPDSLNIINFPVVHQYKLTQLQKSLYDKIYPLVEVMYQSDYRVIVEPNLIYASIMNMLPKPDWRTEKEYNALCIEVFKKAKTIFDEHKRQSTSVSDNATLNSVATPVVFRAAALVNEAMSAVENQNMNEQPQGPEIAVRIM